MSQLEIGMELAVRGREGEPVGTFVVRGLRAQGGQGLVYALRGPGGLSAVLKIPSAKGVLAAEIEQRILLNLPAHKNVMTLLGVTTLQGVDCSVFGWAFQNPYSRLNAPTLREMTKRHRGPAPKTALPATTAIEMVQEVLAALEHMHRYGYVHGDIKPGNVLVEMGSSKTRLSNEEYFGAIQQRAYRTIVGDFGSARSVQFLEDQGRKGERLAPSEFTPVYAPPEIFKKDAAHSLTAVDIYQVGLLLYQVVSGALPYDHVVPGTARGGLTPELVEIKRGEAAGQHRAHDPARLRAARHQDVVFAEAFASERMRERFYEDVERVVDLATAPDPAQRPTVTALRAEFFKLFELEPPGRPPPKNRPQVSVWNPRWHLTRDNRLAEAARVPDRPGTGGAGAAPVTDAPTTRSGATTRGPASSARTTPPARDASGRVRALPPGSPADRSATGRHPVPAPTGAHMVPGSARSGPGAATHAPTATAGGASPPGARRRPPPTAPAGPEPGQALDPAAPLVGLKLALVDDDRVALAVLGRAMRKRGLLVRTFQDPETALEAISRDHPHAAIVDMQMPGISGIELVKRLQRRLNGLPFPMLMLSSVEDEEVLQEAFRHGVLDYLVKPVTEGELAVKLEKAVRQFHEEKPQAVPRELNGFELLEELRRGEVATVYRAADVWERYPEVIKAIKVLRPDVAGEAEPLLKLRREIDVLAGCEHPGLPRMLEAGVVGRLLFYVADELPGRSLGKEVREQGPLPPDEIVPTLRDVGEALRYVHRQGLLVADISPESLARAQDGRIMLVELGEARWLGPALRLDEPAPLRTRFAAPELFDDPPRFELSADLYSLGVTVIEAYSGKPAPRNRATGAIDVAALTQGLPAPVVEVLARLVAPNAGDRYPSAEVLLADLEHLPS